MCPMPSTSRYANFTEQELVNLTLSVIAINGWNHMCMEFRAVPGEYQPAELSHAR
jgi:hypothetical protein